MVSADSSRQFENDAHHVEIISVLVSALAQAFSFLTHYPPQRENPVGVNRQWPLA
jgi:hypothetical protein